MVFGQIIVGPPGSGKSTYCQWIHTVLNKLGRKTVIVNLDPANQILTYPCHIDITKLTSLENVMSEFGLGPNGGITFCMEVLETNVDWLDKELESLKDTYVLFDCPGQIELYTHHPSMRNILNHLTKRGHKLCVVQLVDAMNCTDAAKYISSILTSLTMMLQLELPHINILSKLDLIESNNKLDFPIDFYTEVQDLSQLVETFHQDPFLSKFRTFHAKLCDVMDDYGLVSFLPLDWEQPKLVQRVLKLADKANGYFYGEVYEEDKEDDMFSAWEQWQAEAVQDGMGGGQGRGGSSLSSFF